MISVMRIWLNPEKLAALGITPGEVNAAVAGTKYTDCRLEQLEVIQQPGTQIFEYSVLTNSRINTEEQFEKYHCAYPAL
jgi:HAE1 family hydrophobic/amphiphilic exporter-1